jgi:hypothetical protein
MGLHLPFKWSLCLGLFQAQGVVAKARASSLCMVYKDANIATADEAKISGEQARSTVGLAEVMQRLKEFEMGNRS